jgi:serine/threonine protein kinase
MKSSSPSSDDTFRWDRLGPYEILSRLGRIGEVYRARDSKLDRDVAIKKLARASRGPMH